MAPDFGSAHGGPPTISLSVVVANTDSLGNGLGIQNDGQGAYVDGTQSVQAVLDQYGNFAFNTLSGGRHAQAVRWVVYSFANPVDPTNTYRPDPSNAFDYHFSSGGTAFSPFVPIQYLGTTGYPTSECMYMGNSFSNSTTTWRVSFHKGEEDTQTTPTAFAVVTRTSISPAAWTVQPMGACSPNSNVASLRNNATDQLYGYYYVPFFFTLTAR